MPYDGVSWTLLPAILPPVLGTAGSDMHLLVPGKGQVRPEVLRTRGSGRAHCPSSKITPGGRPWKPRGTLPWPFSRPRGRFKSSRLRTRGRYPGVARAGTEAAVPAGGRGSTGPSRG